MKRLNSIRSFTRRLGAGAVALLFALSATCYAQAQAKKPNIFVLWGDDIGLANVRSMRCYAKRELLCGTSNASY
jgi:hypothetical protein